MTDLAARPGKPVRVLPDTLVDQIAAGEVVERPASVVKELVENALDAGAKRLHIEIREGGRAFIAVSDDGCGMSPEDARTALRRHATSKLGEAPDLARIETFGFRGEALPAIASVSRLRLRTRPAGAAEAFEIRIEAGELKEARAAAGPVGTRIEVAELFAAVPARRKFLKTAATEWGHVADWLARAALARPDVHFDLHRDDRPASSWPAVRDPRDRIAAVLSDDVAAALVAVDRVEGPLRIQGFASRPDFHRATAAGVYLFVNGRPVRDRLLRHALFDVYRDVLPRGRQPSAVLFLEIPPEQVDVNVHPAKWEVRFADPQAVHRAVHRAVRAAVAERAWLGAAQSGESPPSASAALPGPTREARAAGPPGAGDWSLVAGLRAEADRIAEAPADPALPRLRFADLRLIGQVFDTYLVAEGKETLLWIDQHAAHERVLYEGLRAQRLGSGVERQGLLIPATLELDAATREALLEAADTARALGFEIEAFGEGAVVVRSIPALLAGRDPVALVRDLGDELRRAAQHGAGEGARSRLLADLDRVLATMACHGARRAGDRLPPEEQRALLEALDRIPWAPTCPHGRPVAVPVPLHELERQFSRR